MLQYFNYYVVFINFFRAYVRIVKSVQPGCGKSLYVKRLGEKLKHQKKVVEPIVSIPLHGPKLRLNWIMDQVNKQPISNKIIHLDVSNLVGTFFLAHYWSFLILAIENITFGNIFVFNSYFGPLQ